MVCENIIRRGLREDVDVGDLERGHEREIHNLSELGGDVRSFRELLLWHALAGGQVPRCGDEELTAVLRKGVEIALNRQISKASPAFANLLRRVAPLVHDLGARFGKMSVLKTP